MHKLQGSNVAALIAMLPHIDTLQCRGSQFCITQHSRSCALAVALVWPVEPPLEPVTRVGPVALQLWVVAAPASLVLGVALSTVEATTRATLDPVATLPGPAIS